jgi:hypothetical protein
MLDLRMPKKDGRTEASAIATRRGLDTYDLG